MREDPVKGDDEDNIDDSVMDMVNDGEDDVNDDDDDVNNDFPRYERRRSHVLREKKRHGEWDSRSIFVLKLVPQMQ